MYLNLHVFILIYTYHDVGINVETHERTLFFILSLYRLILQHNDN
jgi:hypothetical protein